MGWVSIFCFSWVEGLMSGVCLVRNFLVSRLLLSFLVVFRGRSYSRHTVPRSVDMVHKG